MKKETIIVSSEKLSQKVDVAKEAEIVRGVGMRKTLDKKVGNARNRKRSLFLKMRIKTFFDRKKMLISLVVFLIVVGLGGVGHAIFKRFNVGKKAAEPVTIVEKYRQQLSELEKKARDGKANDLQNYGVAQYATGDLAGAEQTYKKQLTVDNNNAMAHNNLANILRDEKKFDEAAEQYAQAIVIAPNTINSYVNLGNMYQYALSNQDKAIEIYLEGVQNNPKSADLFVLLGIVYEQKGDKENAKINFQKALDIFPENAAAKAGLERLSK